MKKFSKIFDEYISKKFYKTTCFVELVIESDNEGDVGQIVNSNFGGLEHLSDFKIENIIQIPKRDYKKFTLSESTKIDINESIISNWNNKFDNTNPTLIQKMEFYHLLRMSGFEKNTIYESLKNKL
jgi:hypothetical protein